MSDGGINDQFAQKVICDSEGNLYLMGKFSQSMSINNQIFNSNGAFDMFLAKYSNSGECEWVKTFGGPNSESFIDMEIVYESIVIAGRFYDYTVLETDTVYSSDGTDLFVAKLDLYGNILATFSAGGEGVDQISAITADTYGNIYIAGDFNKTISFGEISFDAGDKLGLYLAKLNNSLQVLWAYQFQGDDLKPVIKIEAGSTGDIVATGTFSSSIYLGNQVLTTAEFDEDIYFAKFSTNGDVHWAQRFYSSSMESVVSLSLDHLGNAHISGHYLNHIHFGEIVLPYNLCCGSNEVFVVKISPDGSIAQAEQIIGERANITDIAVPNPNHFFIVGQYSNEIAIRDQILESPYSKKIYIAYFKDDTWLSANQTIPSSSIKIYPTISSSGFYLETLDNNHRKFSIIVTNSLGQLIEYKPLNSGISAFGLNYRPGIYHFKVTISNKSIYSGTLMKN